MLIDPRQARDREEMIQLCTDSYDRSTTPLQVNHDYLRHITASNLSHKARKLFIWLTDNIVRRNFVIASVKQLGQVIEDSKNLSRYIKELEDKRLMYIANTEGNTRVVEIHPGIVFKGWDKRREQYLQQWIATTPLYIRDK